MGIVCFTLSRLWLYGDYGTLLSCSWIVRLPHIPYSYSRMSFRMPHTNPPLCSTLFVSVRLFSSLLVSPPLCLCCSTCPPSFQIFLLIVAAGIVEGVIVTVMY